MIPDERKSLARDWRAGLAGLTGGISPAAVAAACWDWGSHLVRAPDKQAQLLQSAVLKAVDAWQFALRAIEPNGSAAAAVAKTVDRRMADPAWNAWPYNVLARVHGNAAEWWHEASTAVPGVAPGSEKLVEFLGRQLAEATKPANFLPTNPEVLAATRAEAGRNLVRGLQNLLDDATRMMRGAPAAGTEHFRPGHELAVTPGQVVLRNRLIELIQYSPATTQVHAEPVLIVPAWIMKYYILDLSPRNSLVKYLVERGHTVFMISWKNPDAGDRELSLDDYVVEGVGAALDAIASIVPDRQVQAVGYCIGGTLMAIAAAELARRGSKRLRSLTLLAAQVDFTEPGEISLFINPQQLAMLEALMYREGTLDSRRMAGAFMLLRSGDLLWGPAVETYLKGRRPPLNDLMAWNADGTRMPWRMHTDYLYRLYLRNELAQDQFPVAGQTVRLRDIELPLFAVGTETDHVAPWQSVYKLRRLTGSRDFSFLLTSGGHNAGIVSGPVHPRRRYRFARQRDGALPEADQFMAQVAPREGSWWPQWQAWLEEQSSGPRVDPPAMGAEQSGYPPLAAAPGTYVLQR